MKGISKRQRVGILPTNNNDDKVTISSEYYGNDRPSQTLVRLTDAGGNNQTYWCRNCSVEFDPTEENVRRESKLSVPERNIEPAVATTPSIGEESVSIRHQPEIKGALKALKDKGLKITHYEEHIPK